jgi:surfeit locus 1 family protein
MGSGFSPMASPGMTSATLSRLRPLLAPGLATVIALAILVSLGSWQLERKAWKEGLIARIDARAHGAPAEIVPEARWPDWRAEDDEFRRVRVTGMFLHDREVAVHGLMSGGRGSPVQGYYLFTPLRLTSGAFVLVNRGFVPTELRDPARRDETAPAGEVTLTGLVRAPETRGPFMPENEPAAERWFTRDIAAMARARGLERAAPFWIDLDPVPSATVWPRPGQTRFAIPNNHLGYALTWFGLALTLVAVFGAWAWRQRQVPPAKPSGIVPG